MAADKFIIINSSIKIVNGDEVFALSECAC
jgi:hypothetical protein